MDAADCIVTDTTVNRSSRRKKNADWANRRNVEQRMKGMFKESGDESSDIQTLKNNMKTYIDEKIIEELKKGDFAEADVSIETLHLIVRKNRNIFVGIKAENMRNHLDQVRRYTQKMYVNNMNITKEDMNAMREYLYKDIDALVNTENYDRGVITHLNEILTNRFKRIPFRNTEIKK